MIPWKTIAAVLLTLACPAGALAQGESDPLPPRPPAGVLDLADVLSPEQEADLERRIAVSRDTRSLSIYVITQRVTPGVRAEVYATAIKSAWVREEDSEIVVLYDRLNHTVTFAATAGVERRWTALDLQSAFARATETARNDTGDASDLSRAGDLVYGTAKNLLEDRMLISAARDTRPKRWESRFWLLVLPLAALLSVSAAGLLGFVSWQARAARRRNQRTVFPVVDVPQRLGASYSGGTHASIGE